MEYDALWAEIQASPACAPHIVPSFPKADEAARIGDAAIAAILSDGRVRIDPLKMLSDGEVAVALDMDARSNPTVARVQRELVDSLRARVAHVELWRWNPGHKGLDDMLAATRRAEVIK